MQVLTWNEVSKEGWTYRFGEKQPTYLVYKLTRLPDFTAARFEYLCEDKEGRISEVLKHQMQMLRQFHGLGDDWNISLRLLKDEQITLYLVFRYAGWNGLTETELEAETLKIQNSLMRNEYSFERVLNIATNNEMTNISWATQAAVILKEESLYKGEEYPIPGMPPQKFYVPYTWGAADNDMKYICEALLMHTGKVVVEVTVKPTDYLESEKEWMNVQIARLKEGISGETLRSPENNKVLWKGNGLPGLKIPLDNCEKLNKQYETSRIFLSSIRVFAESNADSIANAFLVNSVKNKGAIKIFTQNSKEYMDLCFCYKNVELSPFIKSDYWKNEHDVTPFRAQRLNSLVSLEEISNFFRIPIPVKAGFAGFGFDTGLDDFSSKKKARSIIRLGNYLDESTADAPVAQFDSQQMAKHGLIVGVPGSGKTTAMFNILYQLWAVPEEQRIPFIILEPAKTEYRALKTLSEFKDDLLVFTLGDESVSPFRFNPMEVLPGIKIENHISRLQACFVGAFDLFDPLPIFLEQAIRRTYMEKGWYEDSRGGEEGLETPTLSDLCRNAEYIVSHSGFDAKMRSDFQASLLERLNSLRRGSKGRMLDTKYSIPMEELMNRPIVLELDSLNGDEKSLLMMFLLSYVYEYCKVQRKSGSVLKHMLLVEEAHNLIGAQGGGGDNRANPKAQTIELFVNMLAEMRALGQGILIADQLPTAIAPQAVKQTNVKVLMRVTAKDDREEIGNTMDLNEEQMHQVVNFKTGHAYLYHEGEDRVRMVRMLNFKGEHDVEEPPTDEELKVMMSEYELSHPDLYYPYPQCSGVCKTCNRRTRNQAESFVQRLIENDSSVTKIKGGVLAEQIGICGLCYSGARAEIKRIRERYKVIGKEFGECVYIHLLNQAVNRIAECKTKNKNCKCSVEDKEDFMNKFKLLSKGEE